MSKKAAAAEWASRYMPRHNFQIHEPTRGDVDAMRAAGFKPYPDMPYRRVPRGGRLHLMVYGAGLRRYGYSKCRFYDTRECAPGELEAAFLGRRAPVLAPGFGPWPATKQKDGLVKVGCKVITHEQAQRIVLNSLAGRFCSVAVLDGGSVRVSKLGTGDGIRYRGGAEEVLETARWAIGRRLVTKLLKQFNDRKASNTKKQTDSGAR